MLFRSAAPLAPWGFSAAVGSVAVAVADLPWQSPMELPDQEPGDSKDPKICGTRRRLCKKQEDEDWSKDSRIHCRVSNSPRDTIPKSLLLRQEDQPNQREPSQIKKRENKSPNPSLLGLDQETELRIQLPTEDAKKRKKKPNPYFP